MRSRTTVMRFVTLPLLVVGLALPATVGCDAAEDLKGLAEGCDEFSAGATFDADMEASVGVEVKAFMQASADLAKVGADMKVAVKTACVGIATDLGATDTWTAKGDSDDAVTEACNAASAKIDAIMQAGAQANANFALTVAGGKCVVNASAQSSCEASCQVDATCTEPSVDVRCSPGDLSVECSGNCQANATCEGSATVAANCQGKCEAECTGTCSGECNGTITGGCTGTCEGKCDGVATPAGGQANCTGTCEGQCTQPAANAQCQGKCAASCNGTCKGECKLDASANINCGASVKCKGGCSVAGTAPECQGELTPPTCEGDADCQGSCSASASIKAECSPPQVKLICNVSATSDIPKLVAALEAHLPALLEVTLDQSVIALKAVAKVTAAAQNVVSAAGSLGGKAIACAGAAAEASVTASASVNVSVNASASASGSATSNAS